MKSRPLIVLLFLANLLLGPIVKAETTMTAEQLPAPIQTFLSSIKNNETAVFESLFQEDSIVDDWGTVFKGKKDIMKFSESHLLGISADYQIEKIEDSSGGHLLDGIWKSTSFTGPTRFIFKLNGDKIEKLVISSPRWFDRLYIQIKSIF